MATHFLFAQKDAVGFILLWEAGIGKGPNLNPEISPEEHPFCPNFHWKYEQAVGWNRSA